MNRRPEHLRIAAEVRAKSMPPTLAGPVVYHCFPAGADRAAAGSMTNEGLLERQRTDLSPTHPRRGALGSAHLRHLASTETFHFGVNSLVQNVDFALYRDFPDPQRQQGAERV